jgi:cytochrome c553
MSAMRPASSRFWLWRIVLVASALAAFLYASSTRYSLDAAAKEAASTNGSISNASSATRLSWHARLHEVYLKHSQNYAKQWQQQGQVASETVQDLAAAKDSSSSGISGKQQLRVYDDEDLPEELKGIEEDTLIKDKYR